MTNYFSLAPVFLCVFIGSGVEAQQPTTQCPPNLRKDTILPPGARIIGKVSAGALALDDAVPALGEPSAINAKGRTLREVGPDNEEGLNAGANRKEWHIVPGPLSSSKKAEPYLLACRYGKDLSDALSITDTSVLLLLPLPAIPATTCTVIRGGSNLQSQDSSSTVVASCEPSQ